MKISKSAKNAIFIGMLCSISYLAVYVARNLLGSVTPQMIEKGFTEEYIGKISSLYFVLYAVGQLINGVIGDKIKAKWMISLGLLGAGITNVIFVRVVMTPSLAMLAYGLTGFCLSMVYGPMTKVVSENTEPIYATRCSIGYTFSSFFGTPMAGVLAAIFVWQTAFDVTSGILVLMAIAVVLFFTVFERKGIVRYGLYKPQKKGLGNIKILFKYQIIKFSLISILTGVVRTSIIFWLPTYISQYLGFSSKSSATIFTIASVFISMTTFIAIFVYERLGYDMDKSILLFFLLSTSFFAMTYCIRLPILNIILIVIAIITSSSAAAIMWSRYCPSLRDTGMVSSVTGFLDCLSYVAAAIANLLFADAVKAIGWENLILVWLGLMILGIFVALPYKKRGKV